MSFSVIIPSRTPDNLKACVECIRDAHETSRIIVVDDFDTEKSYALRTGGPEVVRDCKWIPGVKPFVFSRNVNLGILAAATDDVILLNDDALLKTHLGFSWLAAEAKSKTEYGILAAAVDGACGCVEQQAQAGTRVRLVNHHTVVFIAVYIRRAVLDMLFEADSCWLDENFTDYGYDDDDMCERVRQLGLKLGVFDGCIVDHGTLVSTYRGPGAAASTDLAPNRQRFIAKWGFAPGQGPSMRKQTPIPTAPIFR